MARPLKQPHKVSCRLTEEEYRLICNEMEKNGKSLSDVIRGLINKVYGYNNLNKEVKYWK